MEAVAADLDLAAVVEEQAHGGQCIDGHLGVAALSREPFLGPMLQVGGHEQLARDEQHDDGGGGVQQGASHGGVSVPERRGGRSSRALTGFPAAPRIVRPGRGGRVAEGTRLLSE